MAQKVNLDALVPREDFEIEEPTSPAAPISTIQIRDLEENAFFYAVIRKPDFQRETSEWGPDKIVGFVESFLAGDLIPALILWRSGSQQFLIDGAHRISALIAWVHDDYGDGNTSKRFFDGVIPDEQITVADRTRHLAKRSIGSYVDHKFSIQHPDKAKPDILERARRLGSMALQLQWVQGDAKKAEASFFKINQQASPIDRTELRLLKSRTLPNALAARAIVRSGTGHKYWSRFDENVRLEIESQAKAINELLFSPALRTPIRTLDLPVAGRGYSSQTLPLVFDFVNLVNKVASDNELKPDLNGDDTITYLGNCRTLANRISGTNPASLGLHPAVYFYSSAGRYQPTAFLAMVSLLLDFEKQKRFRDFTKIRGKFEDFLLAHKILVNQVVVKFGSGAKSLGHLKTLFQVVVDGFLAGKNNSQVIEALQADKTFSFIQPAEVDEVGEGKDFGTDAKSAIYMRGALKDPLRCAICNGLIHRNSISVDHITRRSEGGLGNTDNGQLTHPFCNTTVKH